jgi:hypothetical protein
MILYYQFTFWHKKALWSLNFDAQRQDPEIQGTAPNPFPFERHRREIPGTYRLADFNRTLCTFSGGYCRLARHDTVTRSETHLHYIKVINIARSGPFRPTCRVTISKGCESHHTHVQCFRPGDRAISFINFQTAPKRDKHPCWSLEERSTKQLQAETPKLALHVFGLRIYTVAPRSSP